MSDLEKVNKLVDQFQTSLNFYILKSGYNKNEKVKKYLDTYRFIIKNNEIDINRKYVELDKLLNENFKFTKEAIKEIYKISWNIDYNLIDDENLRNKAKKIMGIIKEYFENLNTRFNLTADDLYKLYIASYQMFILIKNNKLYPEVLDKIEKNVRVIEENTWKSSLNNPGEFKNGEPFMFAVSCLNDEDLIKENVEKIYNSEIGSEIFMISNNSMGLPGEHKFGFIYPKNSIKNMDMTPQKIDESSSIETLKENNQKLNNDNTNIVSRLNVEIKEKPIGVYCIDYGEKDINPDYVEAKNIASKYNLPFIEIDISLYRTKKNIGDVITDREPLSMKEEKDFVRKFLFSFYQKKKGYDKITARNFVATESELYKDMIIDLFYSLKEKGIVNAKNMFDAYEEKRKLRKKTSESFISNTNEMRNIEDTLKRFDYELKNCNQDMKEKILLQASGFIERLKGINDTVKNMESYFLSEGNIAFKKNEISDQIYKNYTPFKFKKISFNGEDINVVCGYKTKEEIEQDKIKMLNTIDLISAPSKKIEHAKRVIEIKCNSLITNALNNKMDSYVFKNPEVNSLAKIGVGINSLSAIDNQISKYYELIKRKEKLETEIEKININKRILDGENSVEFISQKQKELEIINGQYSIKIAQKNSELEPLKKKKDSLLKENQELIKKGFISKMIGNKDVEQNELEIKKIEVQIKKIESSINELKRKKVYEEGNIEQLEKSFLEKYAPSVSTFEEYKKKLEILKKSDKHLVDESRLYELENDLGKLDESIKLIKNDLEDKRKQITISKKNVEEERGIVK